MGVVAAAAAVVVVTVSLLSEVQAKMALREQQTTFEVEQKEDHQILQLGIA